MGPLLNSYLKHIRGHGGLSPWILLAPLGWFVGACSAARNFSYDHGIAASSEPPVPVVSVGNLTHGGTNKTPFVEMLARRFYEAGLSPGIVMRGYGRRGKERLFAGDNPGSRDLLGDEALLLSKKLPGVPVAVAADRLSGVEFLAEKGAGVAVADDGFQHRRMGRDVDIVLVDATCPFGNGRLMPDGMLREPVKSLERAHMAVISKADQVPQESLAKLKEKILELTGREPFTAVLELAGWSRLSGGLLEEATELPSSPLAAFSAIGNPSSFESFLLKFGISPLFHQVYRDHHRYAAAELDAVLARAKEEGAVAMVCTEKD
ncbi:MAG TPA: tetraacyldisaccharide 4'-kinase, partial [Synergistetes bacterium]|nr:tetraacyldisaccharide 4'-kinase [Synergistota bacterium]